MNDADVEFLKMAARRGERVRCVTIARNTAAYWRALHRATLDPGSPESRALSCRAEVAEAIANDMEDTE